MYVFYFNLGVLFLVHTLVWISSVEIQRKNGSENWLSAHVGEHVPIMTEVWKRRSNPTTPLDRPVTSLG